MNRTSFLRQPMKTLAARRSRRLLLERLESRALLATITVTSLGDSYDPVIDGQVTLAEAVQAAETDSSIDGSTAGSGADEIVFATSLTASDNALIRLSAFESVAVDGTLGSSAFRIKSDITITGPGGVNGITIERNSPSEFRLFHVFPGASLTLRALTLKNGVAHGGGGGFGGAGGGGGTGIGGAILNQGTLRLFRTTITNSIAVGGNGGGASGTNGGGGGGSVGATAGSATSLTGTKGSDPNGGTAGGGDAGVGGGGGGGTSAASATAASAVGGDGGNGGMFGGGGGGGFAYAFSSSFSGNAIAGDGGNGGFGAGGGGGGSARARSLSDASPGTRGLGGYGAGEGSNGSESTSAFTSTGFGGGGAGMGGAIFNWGGNVEISQCTISGNTAEGGKSGNLFSTTVSLHGEGLGGALFNLNGNVTINSSTIAFNATQDVDFAGRGGSIYSLGDGGTANTVLNNTIVANSFSRDLEGTVELSDFDWLSGAINSGSFVSSGNLNLIELSVGYTGTLASSGDPQLLPLSDRGGPTLTHGLAASSPAIDAGNNALMTVPTDQRGGGFPRIYDGNLDGNAVIDVGATEFHRFDFGDAPDTGRGANGVRAIAQLGPDAQLSNMGPDGDANFGALNPEIVYNATNNEYFVVWQGDTNDNPATDDEVEIFGQRVNAATGERIGGRIRISRQGSDGDTAITVFDPAVAWNSANNQYFVTWCGERIDDEFEIFGQRLNGSGTLIGSNLRLSDMGPEDDVNYDAFDPDVAYNAEADQYVVVWHGTDEVTGPNSPEIFGQRLAANATEIGPNDFRISSLTSINAAARSHHPVIAWNSVNNDFLVAWEGLIDTFEIYVHRLSSLGAELGDDVVISDMGNDPASPLFRAFVPDIVHNSVDNQYLVVWEGDDDARGSVDKESEIYGQRLSNNAAELGANDFRISSMGSLGDTRHGAVAPAVAYNPTRNQYLVAWDGQNTDPLEREIFAQQLSSTGALLGPSDFKISTQGPAGDGQFQPSEASVAYNGTNDRYQVVWHGDVSQPGEYEIFGQRIGHVTTPNYQTLRDDNGARHLVRPGLRIGASLDSETDGRPNAAADGDDILGSDDENGLVNEAADLDLTVGESPAIRIRATNNTGAVAQLFGWIDYNRDGIFSNATERASINVPTGSINVQFTLNFPAVPAGSVGTRFARFRLATEGAANPFGLAVDGEVEDYAVTISNASGAAMAADSLNAKSTQSSEPESVASANASPSPSSVAEIERTQLKLRALFSALEDSGDDEESSDLTPLILDRILEQNK